MNECFVYEVGKNGSRGQDVVKRVRAESTLAFANVASFSIMVSPTMIHAQLMETPKVGFSFSTATLTSAPFTKSGATGVTAANCVAVASLAAFEHAP